MSGTNEHGQDSNLADALIREASEHAVARSAWTRKRMEQSRAPASPVEPAPVPAAQPALIVENVPPPPTPAGGTVPLVARPPVPNAESPANTPAPVAEAAPVPVAPAPLPALPETTVQPKRVPTQDSALAVFCFETPTGEVGQYLSHALPALQSRGTRTHLFTRNGFFAELKTKGVAVHNVGDINTGSGSDFFAAVEEFSKLAHHSFEDAFGDRGGDVVLLASEWSGIHAAMALSAAYGLRTLFSIHSLECQRSDMSSPLSKDIQEIERLGLRQSDAILVHNAGSDPLVRQLAPESSARIVPAVRPFPMDDFTGVKDAGEIKARYQIGPIDPLLLFVGNFDHRHGADIMVKAAPAILKNHPQARFVIVGDGDLQWPMRVHARYLLLEYAIRFAGHVEGEQLRELIQAAQIVCVPSRERTEDWPILAAWAAKKPILATHEAAGSLLQHERNSILIYPQENSFVWGAEKLLFNEGLRTQLADTGHARLKEFGSWDRAAEQIQEAMGVLA
jgi:glycosyltransferase involved in cell wall biosynthesis